MSSCDSIFKGSVNKIDYIYTILASVVAGSGFLLDSETIIIGSMLLSPLMKPMLLMFHKLASKNHKKFFINFGHLGAFVFITIASGIFFGKIVSNDFLHVNKKRIINSSTISGRTIFKTEEGRLHIGLLSIVAISCGIALALSNYYDSGMVSATVVGASISTSILPPLVGGGISFGIGDKLGAYSGVMLSFLNLGLIFVSFGITEKMLCK